MATQPKQAYLAVYDYGQGGVWCLIDAASVDEIKARYPELKIFSSQPDWMSQTLYDRIASTLHLDINDEPRGWLRTLIAERKDA